MPPNTHGSFHQGHLSIIIATFAVSTASIMIRIAQSPAIVIAFWRVTLSAGLLLPFMFRKSVRTQFQLVISNPPIMGWQFVAGFFLSLHFWSWFQSVKYSPIAVSVLLANSSPIWVLLISTLFLKKKIAIPQLAGVILGILGMFIISVLQTPLYFADTFNEGVILALIGALMIAGYFLVGQEVRIKQIPNIPWVFFINTSCSGFLLFYSWLLGLNVAIFPLEDLIWFIALAIGPSLAGHALYIYAMKFFSAQTVSMAVIGEAVGASLLAIFIFNENLPMSTIIGGLLVFLAIFLNIKYDKGLPKPK
ncbi:MAG: DMT family transporter [Candidatus Thorarchaeota archaeon]